MGHDLVKFTVYSTNMSLRSTGKPHCVRDQCIEDGLQVGRRGGDNPQHLSGRRLLLERFDKIAVASLQLFEQPHVLNGNDRLRSEDFKQCDLPFGERSNFSTPDIDNANGDTFAKQWN